MRKEQMREAQDVEDEKKRKSESEEGDCKNGKKFGRDKKMDQGLMMKIGAILLGTL